MTNSKIIVNDEQEGIQKELVIAYLECVQQLMKSRTHLFSSFSTLCYYIIKQDTQNIILGPKIAAFLCGEVCTKEHIIYTAWNLCYLTTLLIHNIAGKHSFKNRDTDRSMPRLWNFLTYSLNFVCITLLIYMAFIHIANIKRMLILKTHSSLFHPHTHLALPTGLLHYEFVTCNV